ncbi:MAG: hypothetical protein ACFFB3_22475, partial [Candidatus Hodarchaeota archaeon]
MSDKRLSGTVALPGISDLKAIQLLQTYPPWMDKIWKSKTLPEGLTLALSQNTNIPSDLAEIIHSYGIKAIEFIKEYYKLMIRIQTGVDLEIAREELRDLWNHYHNRIPIAHFFAKSLETIVKQVLLGLDRKDRSITRSKDRKAKLLEYQILPTYLETINQALTPWVEMENPVAAKIIEQKKAEGIPSDVFSYRFEILETLSTGSSELPETYPKLLEVTNKRLQKWNEKGYLKTALLEITGFEDVLEHMLKESGLTYSRLTELIAAAKDLVKMRPYLHILRVMEAVEERFKPRFNQISIEVQLKMFLKNELTGEDLTWLKGLLFEGQSSEARMHRLRLTDQEVTEKLVEYWKTKQTVREQFRLGEAKSEEDAALTEKFAGKILNFVVFYPLSTLKLFNELYDWITVHVSDIGIETRAVRDQYRRIMQIAKAIGNLVKEIQLVCPDMDSEQIRTLLHSVFMGERYIEVLQKIPSTPSALAQKTFREDSLFKTYPNIVANEGWWPLALETLIQFEEKVKQIGTARLVEKKDEFDLEKAYISVASALIKQLSSLSAQALSESHQTFSLPGYDADFSIRKTLNPLVEIERRTRIMPIDVFLQVLDVEVPMPMGSQTAKQILVSDIFRDDIEQYEILMQGIKSQTHILDLCDFFSQEIVRTLISNMLPHYERLGLENTLESINDEYVSLLRQMRNSIRKSVGRDEWGKMITSLMHFSEIVDRTLDKTHQFRNSSLVQLANYILQPSKFLQGVLKDLGYGRKGIIRESIEKTLKEVMTLQRLLRR